MKGVEEAGVNHDRSRHSSKKRSSPRISRTLQPRPVDARHDSRSPRRLFQRLLLPPLLYKDAGKLPLWKDLDAPEIAVAYWHRKLEDEGSSAVRERDEAKYREVNHTLGIMNQNMDTNAFVSVFGEEAKAHPRKGLKNSKPVGWMREEAL